MNKGPVAKITQNKKAEKEFFNELSKNIERYSSYSREEHEYILRKLGIEDNLNRMHILEAGCATGEVGTMLVKKNAKVTGVDISEGMILLNCKLNRDIENYSCVVGDLEDASIFLPNSFDAAICFGVFHHFHSLEIVIRNFFLWLRPGGIVFVVEPNGGNLVNLMSKLIRRIVNKFFPKILSKKKLSSTNEERDHNIDYYLKLFSQYGFDCDFKDSLSMRESFFEWRGFNIVTLIYMIKWPLFCLANLIPTKKINQGSLLIFKMKLRR